MRSINHRFISELAEFSGILFMMISTILFYRHLYVASTNPEWLVNVYFNEFGEGTIELILFSCFIPFIIYSFFANTKEMAEVIAYKKELEKVKENEN